MSDRHEGHVCELFGMRRSPGSGNQAKSPLDGRHNAGDHRFPLGADCKSTLGKSLSVTPEAWRKLVDQAHGLMPVMPLRWYPQQDLARVSLDLAVVDLNDLFVLWDAAEQS